MANQQKKPPLTEIDLARAATASERQRLGIVRAGAKEGGYPYYKGFNTNLPTVLKAPISSALPAPNVTRAQIARIVKKACGKRKGEKDGNCRLAQALFDFVVANGVAVAAFDHAPVSLGRAGRRHFWIPYILEIVGKRYIAFIDPRLRNGLDAPSRKFVYSIMHTYVRSQDEIRYGELGFLIFQFKKPVDGKREIVAHYDNAAAYWDDAQIGKMVDTVYRTLDEIERKKAA